MWGWTDPQGLYYRIHLVNPTYVGTDRQSQHISALLNGKPHARGDEP